MSGGPRATSARGGDGGVSEGGARTTPRRRPYLPVAWISASASRARTW